MLYPYITLPDETLITHTHIKEKDGVKIVDINFERPTSDGFDTARCRLPSYEWIMREGNYSDDEIAEFENIVRNTAHSFYKYAEMGGLDIAKAV
ncbi:MAG: hypothetical protein FWE60_05515 [Oscillospiraceae bacterium]|jgi:hypothetical protein|nr:hypothetical protein [Oscillospiraceae bacterium]